MNEFKQYCEKLGSTSPTPGGGSAVALVLSLGASSAEKAVRFSLNDYSEEFLNSLIEIRDSGLQLSENDQLFFSQWMEARKLPKTSDDEKKIREEKVNYFAKQSILVPYEISKRAIRLLEIIQDFVPHCNKWLISDLGVGASLARSAFDGAVFNIYTNFPYLKDINLNSEINEFLKDSIPYASKITENTYRLCNNILIN